MGPRRGGECERTREGVGFRLLQIDYRLSF